LFSKKVQDDKDVIGLDLEIYKIMVKREISEVEEGSAKRRKVTDGGDGASTVEQVESARQLQQQLTFQQDSVPQLRKGMSAKMAVKDRD